MRIQPGWNFRKGQACPFGGIPGFFPTRVFPRQRRKLTSWLEINTQYAQVWPNITVKREPPPDAKDWEAKPDKASLFFAEPWHW